MFDQVNHLHKELAGLVDRHSDRDGTQSTAIPSISFSRHSAPHHFTGTGAPYRINKPSIYIVVQGLKDVIFGEERFSYGPSNYLVASMDLPIIAEVLEASAEVPNLTCRIEFTHSQILELLSDEELKVSFVGKSKRGMNVAKLDLSMLDAVVRLVRLLDKPADIPVLAPLFTKEILYKVLHGEHGDSLRQIVTDESPTIHIQNAIQQIVDNFQEPFRIEDLADIANMSVSSFHRHFKEITAMSPIQFQKQLRLQESRRQLITQSVDVAEVAFRVGYESPTQFIREYSRMFGVTPKKDMKRLKRLDIQ
ncbi:AraC family transcriptional regulator [Anaerocolumna sp. MB42-C2]|uniref:AraC family transcriptional regulator n=1 Tax=Anaerocolumna sp. MB42-C2 TaxID=3070997 RepID=UPI0027E07429|nr:AraC family transcriptional regulator [Anaerocolumna sp. MB42-C2]WMJ86845.1 AraC family transcriptional regulator [Anaerocolumna sp. MB42-C2]